MKPFVKNMKCKQLDISASTFLHHGWRKSPERNQALIIWIFNRVGILSPQSGLLLRELRSQKCLSISCHISRSLEVLSLTLSVCEQKKNATPWQIFYWLWFILSTPNSYLHIVCATLFQTFWVGISEELDWKKCRIAERVSFEILEHYGIFLVTMSSKKHILDI